MTLATLNGKELHVDSEGFMTEYDEWSPEIGRALAANLGIQLTDAHMSVIEFVRSDYRSQGESPTLRRVATKSGTPTKQLFVLFPKKPAKKMSYIAGVPKPVGCV